MGRPGGARRGVLLAALLLGALGALVSATPAAAQGTPEPTTTTQPAGGGESINARMLDDSGKEQQGIEGVRIIVRLDGEVIGEARSDEDGLAVIPVPGPGTYEVRLDAKTIPKGSRLTDPDQIRLPNVLVLANRPKFVLFPFGADVSEGAGAFDRIVDLAAAGLRIGLIVAVAAVGLSLVFGTTGLINFAQGELVTFGALVAFYLNSSDAGLGITLLAAAPVAFLVGGLFGGGLEIGLWRPLRRRRTGNVALLVVSIGLALVLRSVFQIIFGARPEPFEEYAVQERWDLGPLDIQPKSRGRDRRVRRRAGRRRTLPAANASGHGCTSSHGQRGPCRVVGSRRAASDPGRVGRLWGPHGDCRRDAGAHRQRRVRHGIRHPARDLRRDDRGGDRLPVRGHARRRRARARRGGQHVLGADRLQERDRTLACSSSCSWSARRASWACANGSDRGRGVDFGQVLTDGIRAAIGVNAAAYALAAIGLNVQYGYTGLLNFGQVGFLLVGAYGTAITVDEGAPLWLAVLVGIAAAIGLGLLLGIPTLRLRADYLAIVTISAAEILRIGAVSSQLEGLTGGRSAFGGFAVDFFDLNPISPGRYGIGDVSFDHRTLWIMLVAWALVALSTALVWLLLRSPYGRALRSVREDEDAARSLGKNAFGLKLQSLVRRRCDGSARGDRDRDRRVSSRTPTTFGRRHVLRLHGPDPRWGGKRAGPGRRRDGVLVPLPGPRHAAPAGDRGGCVR